MIKINNYLEQYYRVVLKFQCIFVILLSVLYVLKNNNIVQQKMDGLVMENHKNKHVCPVELMRVETAVERTKYNKV